MRDVNCLAAHARVLVEGDRSECRAGSPVFLKEASQLVGRSEVFGQRLLDDQHDALLERMQEGIQMTEKVFNPSFLWLLLIKLDVEGLSLFLTRNYLSQENVDFIVVSKRVQQFSTSRDDATDLKVLCLGESAYIVSAKVILRGLRDVVV